ncbi:hypothetical protein ACFL3U_01680 [Pseudomonadota bacterium]
MSALKISIPKPTPGHELSIGSQHDEIKSWIKHLPLFDAAITVQKALPVLVELNRTEMDNRLRFHSMHLLTQALKHPIEISRKKYLAIPLPLTGKHKISADNIKHLLDEIANGYKIIISTHISDNNQRLSIDEITKTIYLAIHSIGRLMLDRYLCYETHPPRTWLELTELYRYATTLCVESASINLGSDKLSTIERAYLQILLLVAIHPYRLIHGEATMIYKLMGDWNRHCKIVKPPTSWQPTNELIIRPTEYGIVYHARPDEDLSKFKDIRIIDIDKLKAFMQTHSENGEGVSSTLSERLLRNMFKRLLDGWRSNNVRQSPRLDCANKISIISGLNACYTAFGGRHPKIDHPAHTKMRLIPIEGESDDPWAPAISNTKVKAGDASDFKVDDPTQDIWDDQTLLPTLSDIPKTPSLKHYSAIQTDHSEMGLSVRFDFSSGLKPNVGDLISFQPKSSTQNNWKLGTIRWMELSQKTGVMGIKLFPFTPVPIATKALIGVGRGGDLMQSLLLSPDGLNHPEATIIVPASVYDTGTHLYIEIHKTPAKITLTSLHDFSKSFACYAFKIADI